MHIKTSGKVMLFVMGLLTAGLFVGWIFSFGSGTSNTSNSVLPPFLRDDGYERRLIYHGPLPETWSKKYILDKGYAPEVIPLEEGTTVLVRINGDDTKTYTKDANNILYINGVRSKQIGVIADFIEVRAADRISVGKNCVIYFTIPK